MERRHTKEYQHAETEPGLRTLKINRILHILKHRQRRIKDVVRDKRLDTRFNGDGTDQRV